MKRVIIWGCGIVGKRIYKWIRQYWQKYYNVIGFGDNSESIRLRYREGENVFDDKMICSEITGIYSAEETFDLYKQKCIDVVLLGVSGEYKDEVWRQLTIVGLPVLEFPKHPLISIDKLDKKVTFLAEEKMKLYTLRDVYIRFDYSGYMMVLYNFEQSLIKESVNFQDNIRTLRMFKKALEIEENVEELDVVCALQQDWTNNYAHFIFDVLSKIVAMKKRGCNGKIILFEAPDTKKLIHILGIDESIIWINDKNEDVIFRAKTLLLLEPNCGETPVMAPYVIDAAKKILENCRCHMPSQKEREYPRKIYFERIGKRKCILNKRILGKYGIVTITPEKLTVEEEIELFANVDFAIVPHGAGEANLVFMKDNATLIELVSDAFFSIWLMNVIAQKKLNYHLLVGQTFERGDRENRSPEEEDFTIEDSLLELTIQTAVKTNDAMKLRKALL